MKHKVSDLDGKALDRAVAMAHGYPADGLSTFKPSSCWAIGGSIIERELIELAASIDGMDRVTWHAKTILTGRPGKPALGYGFGNAPTVWTQGIGAGRTPLIAAMRAYVAGKFGEEVDL